jgi:hypothetical protein
VARARVLTAIVAASLIATGTVLASTIVGTARDDVLRGTPNPDRLYGRAGNGVSSTIPAMYAIGENGQFSFRRRGFGTTPGGGSFTVEHEMVGAFDASGISATGTLSAHLTYDASDGTHFDCVSGDFTWSAQRQ